jgi:hypothetical protein
VYNPIAHNKYHLGDHNPVTAILQEQPMPKTDTTHWVTPRSLLEIPAEIACRIEWAGHAVKDAAQYVMMGVRPGGFARVLARYPDSRPRFVELEVDGGRISLPASLASQVLVSPC